MNNYSWITPGVHAWVAGLVLPVEVEVKIVYLDILQCFCTCGNLTCMELFNHLYQTEAECLAAMKLNK